MSSLELLFKGYAGNISQARVVVDITDENLEPVDSISLGIDRLHSVDVPSGRYLVTARLPSGEVIGSKVAVGPAETKPVMFGPVKSPNEWLEWECFLGIVDRARGETEGGPSLEDFPDTWLRVWIGGRGGWLPGAVRPWRRIADPRVATFQIDLDPDPQAPLRFLQVGGPRVPWRLVALPPSPTPLGIVVRPSRLPNERNGGLAVKVTTWDQEAETLLRLLDTGAVETANVVGDAFVESLQGAMPSAADMASVAERYARAKIANPPRAAIGFYYLLRMGAYERLRDWPGNFATWIDWLPDAPLIHALQLLHAGGGDVPAAAGRLVKAAAVGIPVYTQGLRLLFEWLQVLDGNDALGPDLRHEVADALGEVRRYAEAADWTQPVTSCLGTHPSEPSLAPATGVPADVNELVYVNAV